MELTKFGAVLKFAIELENKTAAFYQEAARVVPAAEAEFGSFAKEAGKARSELERTRREMINEMMLEPIHGFQADIPDLGVKPGASATDAKAVASRLEEASRDFYNRAASEITGIAPAVSRALKRFADGRSKRQAQLATQA